MSVPALSDSGRTSALGRYRASMSPSATGMASAPALKLISGLNHTARRLAVYTSHGGLLHRHARLASGWLVKLSGPSRLPAGSERKVAGHPRLVSQASPGATLSTSSVTRWAESMTSVLAIKSRLIRARPARFLVASAVPS